MQTRQARRHRQIVDRFDEIARANLERPLPIARALRLDGGEPAHADARLPRRARHDTVALSACAAAGRGPAGAAGGGCRSLVGDAGRDALRFSRARPLRGSLSRDLRGKPLGDAAARQLDCDRSGSRSPTAITAVRFFGHSRTDFDRQSDSVRTCIVAPFPPLRIRAAAARRGCDRRSDSRCAERGEDDQPKHEGNMSE